MIDLEKAEPFALAVPEFCGKLNFEHIEGYGVTSERKFLDYQVYKFDNVSKDKKVFRIDDINCNRWSFERKVKLLTDLYQ